jgi:cbb3-type cytochrome oxidase subunit 3
MLQDFLARTEHLHFPLAALILFFLVFLGVIAWVIRGAVRRKSLDHVASLPLEEDDPIEGHGGPAR